MSLVFAGLTKAELLQFPDADTSSITDPVVKAQFEAVMTDEIKANYQTFLEAQNVE